MKIAVKMYAEFGQDPQSISKFYPIKRNMLGEDFVPVYNVPFERAVALYNCGKLRFKYAEQVKAILQGKMKIPSEELGGGEAPVIGKDTIQAADTAGSPQILSNFDTAGVNLQAAKDGAAPIDPVLQGKQVAEEMDKIKNKDE